MTFFSFTENLRENSIKFMGVHGKAWTGASQKTFSKGNKCQNLCFLFCFVSSFLLIIYFRATLLKFFPVSLWPSDSSPSKHHMSIFLDSVSSKSWMLNFLEQKAEEVKKAHFSPQFMTPCRKTAKLLIELLYPPNRKISKCAHVPVFIGNLGSEDYKAIPWSGNKRLERSTLQTKGETGDSFCPLTPDPHHPHRLQKPKAVGTGGEGQWDRWESSSFL